MRCVLAALCVAVVLVGCGAPAAAAFPDNVFTWGLAADGTEVLLPEPLYPELFGLTISKAAVGAGFTVFLTDTGRVYFLGDNSERTACTNVASYPVPTLLDLPDVVDVSAGAAHAVYLFNSTLDRLLMCSANVTGGAFVPFNFPAGNGNLTALLNASAEGVASGDDHFFVWGGSTVIGFGANGSGQLGVSSGMFPEGGESVLFPGETIVMAAGGADHSLLLTDAGLYGAGSNANGQLGLGSTTDTGDAWTSLTSPPGVVFVAAGGDNSIYLTSAATNNVWGSGLNENSQLSTGDRKTRFTPVRSNGGFVTERVAYASVGLATTALVTETGRVYMSGSNARGQLGLGDQSLRANGVFVSTLPCEVVGAVDVFDATTVAVLNGAGPTPAVALVIDEELLVDTPFNIPHTFSPALNNYFVTIEYEVDGPAVLDRYVARFGECDRDEVFVTCTDIGLVTITATSPGLSAESVTKIPCHGTVVLEGLQSIPLGGSVTAVLTINPPAARPFEFEISTADHFIAIPSHTTVAFAAGQSRAAITLTSPANGKIGITSGYISPSILNTYQYVSFSLAVTGTMFSTVLTECSSVELPTTLRVDVDPQAPGTQDIVLALPDGFNASETFEVPNGQRFGTTDVVPLRPFDNATAQFSATLYEGSRVSFPVLSSFFTDFQSDVAPGTFVPVTITLRPPNPRDVRVNIAATNVEIDGSVIVPKGVGVVVLESTPQSNGIASITLTADGFCPRTFTRTVGSDLVCAAGEVPNALGTLCATCPTSAGEVCSLRGECDYSLCKAASALCNCASAFFGSACQYARAAIGDTVFHLELSASFQSTQLELASDGTTATISAPAGIVNGTLLDGSDSIQGTAFSSGASHLASTDNPPQDGIATPYGFDIDATCEDNAAQVDPFLSPVTVRLQLPANYPARAFELIRPFLWDAASSAWVDAPLDCLFENDDEDLSSITDQELADRTIEFLVCDAGQYHVFIIDPEAFGPVVAPEIQTEGRPVETTTGITGFQPVQPPEPQFSPDNRPGEVNRAPISDFSASSAAALVPGAVLAALVALLAV